MKRAPLWTPEEDKFYTELRDAGYSYTEMADHPDGTRTADAIKKRARFIGAPIVDSGRKPTYSEETRQEIIRRRVVDRASFDDIAKEIGCSYSTVRRTIADAEAGIFKETAPEGDTGALGVVEPTHPLDFTPEQIARAKGERPYG